MLEDLMIIVELEQRPIKYFTANKNGVFFEIEIDSSDHVISTK